MGGFQLVKSKPTESQSKEALGLVLILILPSSPPHSANFHHNPSLPSPPHHSSSEPWASMVHTPLQPRGLSFDVRLFHLSRFPPPGAETKSRYCRSPLMKLNLRSPDFQCKRVSSAGRWHARDRGGKKRQEGTLALYRIV